ncbi:hypothetical protein BKN51_20480 [Amycolatopsis sp. BJA-103]|nr:hypothetical protein BKN51_20480 [Amycolatopsis sp. BJA-103]
MDRIRQALGEEKIGYYGIFWGTAPGAEYRTLFDDHVAAMLLDSVATATFDSLLLGARRTWPDSAQRLVKLRSGGEVPSAAVSTRSGFGWDDPDPAFNPQLVGHAYEPVTPLPWAHDIRAHIGGPLLTVEDDMHGSLSILSSSRGWTTAAQSCARASGPGTGPGPGRLGHQTVGAAPAVIAPVRMVWLSGAALTAPKSQGRVIRGSLVSPRGLVSWGAVIVIANGVSCRGAPIALQCSGM